MAGSQHPPLTLDLEKQRGVTLSLCKLKQDKANAVRLAEKNLKIAQDAIWQAEEQEISQLQAYGKASGQQLCNAVYNKLPAELREHIYSYFTSTFIDTQYLATGSAIWDENWCHEKFKRPLPAEIPQYSTDYVGKDFARELTAFLYRTMDFRVYNHETPFLDIAQQIDQHGLRRMDHIRHLSFELSQENRRGKIGDKSYAPFLVDGAIDIILQMKPGLIIDIHTYPWVSKSDEDTSEDMARIMKTVRAKLGVMRSTGHTVNIVGFEGYYRDKEYKYLLDDKEFTREGWVANRKPQSILDDANNCPDMKYLIGKPMKPLA